MPVTIAEAKQLFENMTPYCVSSMAAAPLICSPVSAASPTAPVAN